MRYFLSQGAARLLHHPRDATRILDDWSRFGPDFQAIRARLRALHTDEDPAVLLQAIMGPLAPPGPA